MVAENVGKRRRRKSKGDNPFAEYVVKERNPLAVGAGGPRDFDIKNLEKRNHDKHMEPRRQRPRFFFLKNIANLERARNKLIPKNIGQHGKRNKNLDEPK